MAQFTLQGNPFHTKGDLPTVGSSAPDFSLAKTDLSDAVLDDYTGKYVILNIFPSLDTEVCAMSVRRFNEEAADLDRTVVLCISMDLPFAHSRFCAAEGIEDVVSLSDFRSGGFGKAYGVRIADGPMAGLLARAVLIIGLDGRLLYRQLVPEITEEPDYESALAVLQGS